MKFRTMGLLLAAGLVTAGLTLGCDDAAKPTTTSKATPDKAKAVKAAKSDKATKGIKDHKKAPAKAGAGDTKKASAEKTQGDKAQPVKKPDDKAAAKKPTMATTPPEQTYSLDAIAHKIPENCKEPYAIMATAPNKVGADYDWTWTRQAMLANQQFKVVPGEPTGPWQVTFQVHHASAKHANAWVLVAKCNNGATCNYLAAMYKAVVPGATASPVCGTAKLPMGLGPNTMKKPILLVSGDAKANLPGAKDVKAMCARLQACTVATDPSKAKETKIGLDCQKAPAKFKTACARRYPCAGVLACLKEK